MKSNFPKIAVVLLASAAVNLSFYGCEENLAVNQEAVQQDSLTLKDVNPGVLIGAQIRDDFQHPKTGPIAAAEFSCGQSLWYARWGGWPGEKDYDMEIFNKAINWMQEKGISTQMHMIVGPDIYMPDWLLNAQWTNERLDALLKQTIDTLMESNDNKNKVDVWDVGNEFFADDGTYRTNMIWNQLGWEDDKSGLSGEEKINTRHPVFIRKAFTYCRNKTSKKLEYRDYIIENNVTGSYWSKKHKAVYQLLKHMQKSNIPIDVIGIQGHYDIGNIAWVLENDELKKNVAKFKALGLEVHITELDMGTGQTAQWDSAKAEQQKTDYYNYIKQAIEGGACRIYTWGMRDGADVGWRNNEHPLPWDENSERKPAYYGIRQALEDTRK